ncbi:MAG: redox-sensing transcriptional repressor Rex [Sphaerochaetaceae bacterium]|nr:redox-sensing transcriptional repressor Rex [Sphaerochaetaceae bacterium]
MPYYLEHLRDMQKNGETVVSAPVLAQHFKYTEIQVRKDLASVSSVPGKPKIGFKIATLIVDIENVLGYKRLNKAVLVGCGALGSAFLKFKGFSEYGCEIAAGFDANTEKLGSFADVPVLPMEELSEFCKNENIKLGIITVPAIAGQRVCDQLVEAGIKAIWNFAPIHLIVPEGILVQNENMPASLAMLFNHLNSR